MKNKKIRITTLVLVMALVTIFAGCSADGSVIEEKQSKATQKKVEATAKPVATAKAEDTTKADENMQTFTEPIKITDDTFDAEVLNYEGIVIVDFWATWCGPCVSLAPILEEVMIEKNVKLAKLDVDENPIKSKEYRISAIPAVYIFKNGEQVDKIIGLGSKDTYIDAIEKVE